MSASYSMKGTQPVGVGVKKGSLTTNGNGPPPLSYPADPPDDENMNEIIEENVDLTVFLPDGSKKQQSVESNIPMMDLLINLAASNKLNPAAHSLVVLTGDKWKQIDFKANKTIGLLAGEDRQVSVQIVQKKPEEKVRPKSTAQPFEMTYRFTVNLPHNQKKVLRISPKLTLGEIRQILCKEKNFEPSCYIFLLPGNPNNALDDSTSVGDLKSSEINFVSVAMIDAATSRSMPNLAFAAAASKKDVQDRQAEGPYMPSAGEKKAKRGFLSFLGGKKDKKFKMPADSDTEVRNKPQQTQSFNSRANGNAENVKMRPKTMYTDSDELEHFGLRKTTGDLHKFADKSEFRKSTGSTLMSVNENVILSVKSDTVSQDGAAQSKRNSASGAPPKKSAKKRAAPPPPQANLAPKPKTVQVEIDVHPNIPEQTRIENIPGERVHLKKNHSRNSSDSSGYHELTVSGAESPDGHKVDSLQTTLDTTSIDSAEHFNGDSGIRDMSPVRRRSAKKTEGSSSRDSSHDLERPVAPGRKKKRAPLPPPGMSSNVESTSEPIQTPQEVTNTHNEDEDEEFEALKAMEEVTMKFNIVESDDDDVDNDDDLQMVENSSIHSEDVDIDLAHRQRPPTFVAPPPPTEPPPDDSEPVDIQMLRNHVDTIDIGVGDDTTSMGPDSAKSSPLNTSRRGSNSSNASVNTLEDLSLAFAQTIEAGQEALGFDSDNDSVQEELKKAMPEFKEQLSKLIQDSGEEMEEISPRSHNSEQENESDQSFIIHDNEDTKNLGHDHGNRESSEITYEFTIDSVPADFQNEEKEKEESEESFVMEETVDYYPVPPSPPDSGTPRKIPDLESPKEHKIFSIPAHELHAEIPLDESTPKPNSSAGGRKMRVEVELKEEEEKLPEKPKEKEEFVLTFDELSNVDFSASEPGKGKVRHEVHDPPKVNYRIAFRSSLNDYDYENDDIIDPDTSNNVHQEPVYDVDDFSEEESKTPDNGVKSKCSELSFSPHYEGEAEHLLEEKSISMIALPAERTPVKQSQSENDNANNGASSETFSSSTKIVLSGSKAPASQLSESSPRKEDSFDSNSLLQTQYSQLRQQFQMWQNQLIQNQRLLANQDSSEYPANQKPGKDDQSNLQLQQLQLQIQLQQQMMLQLQQSMQALALQNTLVSHQPIVSMATLPNQQIPPPPPSTQIFTKGNEKYRPSSPIEDKIVVQTEVLSHAPPPTAPAPPPTVTSKPKTSKADAKYSKPKQKKFDRQLDPREQLMLDIRNFGKTNLHKTKHLKRFQLKRPTGINDEEPVYV